MWPPVRRRHIYYMYCPASAQGLRGCFYAGMNGANSGFVVQYGTFVKSSCKETKHLVYYPHSGCAAGHVSLAAQRTEGCGAPLERRIKEDPLRRRFRILAVLLILSLTTALLPAPAMAAETENTGSDFDLLAEIKAANNGDTIQIPMGAVVKNGATDARPLFIEKSVTIQGGSITLWAGGIMLGADVTFKDTSLIFATKCYHCQWAHSDIG